MFKKIVYKFLFIYLEFLDECDTFIENEKFELKEIKNQSINFATTACDGGLMGDENNQQLRNLIKCKTKRKSFFGDSFYVVKLP